MKSLWAYIILKQWWTSPSPSQRPTALIWLPGPDLALQPSWNAFTPPVCFGASQFIYACCNIVFMIHEEPLGIYYIEAMVDLSIPFTATNSSDLAAWARFGTSTLLERVYSSCMFWCIPIHLRMLQHCFHDP